MFSPYYARARRRSPGADPADYVAMNVALYDAPNARWSPGWAMTERGRAALTRDATRLRIGPSAMTWRDGALHVAIDEISVPLPRRLRGTIVLHPAARLDTSYSLDPAGAHRWTPIAPCARMELAFDRPNCRWSGHAYLDSNDGDAPLDGAFSTWDWSRATLADGSTAVLYDATRSDGSRLALARHFTPDGGVTPFDMPPRHTLPRGLWRMPHTAHGEAGDPALLRRFEDSPFYTRSLIATRLRGERVTAVHESLSLDRFRAPWVRALLPFRMPRRGQSDIG